jgi:hypothetical protein
LLRETYGHEVRDDFVVGESAGLLERDEVFDGDDRDPTPIGLEKECSTTAVLESPDPRRLSHEVEIDGKRFPGNDEVESMPSTEKPRLERRSELVNARSHRRKSGESPPSVSGRWANPEVHILGERGRSIEDAGLAADEKVVDPEALKASEEISHREPPRGS